MDNIISISSSRFVGWSLDLKSNDVTSKLKKEVLIMESWQSVQSICGMEKYHFPACFLSMM